MSASSSKFTLLPAGYLASQPPSSEITMQSLLETQDRMAEEAREVMPYSFDECTYSKGYLRQAVWSCIGESGGLSRSTLCTFIAKHRRRGSTS
jgi:E3 ubiquitin-protein ligase UBR7